MTDLLLETCSRFALEVVLSCYLFLSLNGIKKVVLLNDLSVATCSCECIPLSLPLVKSISGVHHVCNPCIPCDACALGSVGVAVG